MSNSYRHGGVFNRNKPRKMLGHEQVIDLRLSNIFNVRLLARTGDLTGGFRVEVRAPKAAVWSAVSEHTDYTEAADKIDTVWKSINDAKKGD